MKISWKLILYVTAVLLFAAAAGCIDDDIQITEEMYSDLDLFGTELQNLFTEFETDLNNAADEISACNMDSEKTAEILDGILIKYPWLKNILLNGEDGVEFIGNPAPDAELDKEYVTEKMFSGKSIIDLPTMTSQTSGTISGVAVPVYSEDGEYLGAISAWWINSYLMKCSYDRFKELSNYHVSIEDNGLIGYDSISRFIGSDLGKTGRIIEYSSANDGTYTQNTIDTIALEPITIKGVWKEVKIVDSVITVYIGKSNQKELTEIPKKYSVSEKKAETAVLGVYSYDRTHTKEETLKYINSLGNLGGGIFNVYAFDKEGTIIAASGDAGDFIGTNEIDFIGSYGTQAIREIMIRASQGFGYVSYYTQASIGLYPEKSIPVTIYLIESEFGDYVTGAIIPMESVLTENDNYKFIEVTQTADSVHEYYLKNGYNSMIEAVRSGYFGDNRISILDYNGKILSSSNHPELSGETNIMYTDDYGNSLTRQLISRAKTGGGYAVYARTGDEIKTVYLYETLPINDEFIVVSVVELDSF